MYYLIKWHCDNFTSGPVIKHVFFFYPEPLPVACARVDALQSHGYRKEGLRLAVAIVETLKHNQKKNRDIYKQTSELVMFYYLQF